MTVEIAIILFLSLTLILVSLWLIAEIKLGKASRDGWSEAIEAWAETLNGWRESNDGWHRLSDFAFDMAYLAAAHEEHWTEEDRRIFNEAMAALNASYDELEADSV